MLDIYQGPIKLLSISTTEIEITSYFVEISPDNVDVRGQGFEIIECFFGTQIASGEDVMNPTRNEEFFKFGWQSVASERNVQISENQDQLWMSNMEIFNLKKKQNIRKRKKMEEYWLFLTILERRIVNWNDK